MAKAQSGEVIIIVEPKYSWGFYETGDKLIVSKRWENDKGVYVELNDNAEVLIYDTEYILESEQKVN